MERTTTQHLDELAIASDETAPLIEGAVEVLDREHLIGIREQARPGGMTMALLGHITALESQVSLTRQRSQEFEQRYYTADEELASLKGNFTSNVSSQVEKLKGQAFTSIWQELQDALKTIGDMETAMVSSIGDIKANGKSVRSLKRDLRNERQHVAQLQREIANILNAIKTGGHSSTHTSEPSLKGFIDFLAKHSDDGESVDEDSLTSLLQSILIDSSKPARTHEWANVNPKVPFSQFLAEFKKRPINFVPGSFKATNPFGGVFESSNPTYEGAVREFYDTLREQVYGLGR